MHVVIIPQLKCKSKDPADIDNYRPIAIATALSKVLEQVMLARLARYLCRMIYSLAIILQKDLIKSSFYHISYTYIYICMCICTARTMTIQPCIIKCIFTA